MVSDSGNYFITTMMGLRFVFLDLLLFPGVQSAFYFKEYLKAMARMLESGLSPSLQMRCWTDGGSSIICKSK